MMATVTAKSDSISLTSRRSGSTWSTATWAVNLAFSAAIPANANITSSVLTVHVSTLPVAGNYLYVDGQKLRARQNTQTTSISISPGTSSRDIAVSFQASGTSYSTSIIVFDLSLSISYEIAVSSATAPTTVKVSSTVAEGAVTLSWSGASGGTQNAITGYQIHYNNSSDGVNWGDWVPAATVATSAGSGSVSVAVNDTRGAYRQWRIRTCGAAGESYYSGWAYSPTVRTNTAPSAPSKLSATPSVLESGAISLSWAASTDATDAISYYHIRSRLSTDGGNSWSGWADVGNVNGLSVSYSPTLNRGAKIQYSIYAVDSFGVASASATFPAVTRNSLPSAPKNITAAPALYESGEITITWEASTDADKQNISYQVYRGIMQASGNFGDTVLLGETTSTSYKDSPSMQRGSKINYSVFAVDTLGASSGAVSNVVTRNSSPSAPKNVTATPALYESGGITLTWTASTDPDGNLAGYYVQRQLSADGATYGDWSDVETVQSPPVQLTPNMSRGTFVRYRVQSYDALGAASGLTESNPVRRNRVPAAPALYGTSGLINLPFRPCFAISAPSEPDGEGMQVQAALFSEASEVVGANWSRHAIYLSGPNAGTETASNNRISDLTFYDADQYLLNISPNSQVKYTVFSYDADKAFLKWDRWYQDSDYTLDENAVYFRVEMAFANDQDITDENIPLLEAVIKVCRKGETQIMAYTQVATLPANGGFAAFRLPQTVETGRYRVLLRLVDASGGAGEALSAAFSVGTPSWARSIASGTVIASETISHQAELTEMLSHVNAARARFGLADMALPGRLGYFADWLTQMQALAQGAADCYALLGENAAIPQQATNYPSAATVSAVRALAEGV